MGYSFLMPKTLASAITVAGAAGGGQQMRRVSHVTLAVMQRWASNRIHLSDHLRPASDSTCHRKHAPEFNVFHYEILISANERQIPVRNLLRVTTVTILAGVLFLLPFVCLSVSSIHQCKTYMYSFFHEIWRIGLRVSRTVKHWIILIGYPWNIFWIFYRIYWKSSIRLQWEWQEAQQSPRDRAIASCHWNLANATQQCRN